MVNVIAMWIQSDHTMLVNANNEPSNANFFLIDFLNFKYGIQF